MHGAGSNRLVDLLLQLFEVRYESISEWTDKKLELVAENNPRPSLHASMVSLGVISFFFFLVLLSLSLSWALNSSGSLFPFLFLRL